MKTHLNSVPFRDEHYAGGGGGGREDLPSKATARERLPNSEQMRRTLKIDRGKSNGIIHSNNKSNNTNQLDVNDSTRRESIKVNNNGDIDSNENNGREDKDKESQGCLRKSSSWRQSTVGERGKKVL